VTCLDKLFKVMLLERPLLTQSKIIQHMIINLLWYYDIIDNDECNFEFFGFKPL